MKKKSVSKTKALEIANKALTEQIAAFEISIECLRQQAASAAKFPRAVYKKLWPQSLDAPDGKWFPMDDEYTKMILKEIDELKKKNITSKP